MSTDDYFAQFFKATFSDLYHKEDAAMRAPQKRRVEKDGRERAAALTLTERVDRKALDWIDARRDSLMDPATATTFAKYAASVRRSHDGCSRVVDYDYSSYNVGRLYAVGSLSLASLKRPVRGTLARHIYYDIDMSNAHPSVLLHLVERAKGKAPCLRRYVENRDETLAELPYATSIAKRIFLAMINGGGHVKVLKKAGVESLGISPFAEAFKDEMKLVAQRIHAQEERLHMVAKDKTGRAAHLAVMSYAMQEIEMAATLAAIEFLRSRGWVVGAVIHDGFLTERRDDAELDEATLMLVSQHVRSVTGIDIPFEIKQFDEFYEIGD
jgi:hypothetical protein